MGLFRRSRELWAELYPPPQKVFVIVQSLSHVQLFATPWTVAHQASPSSTISQSLLRLMSTESAMLSNHLILCCPFFSCPQSFPSSEVFPMSQLFTSGGPSIEASTSASVLPVSIQGWLVDWFDLLAVQGTLKSLHHLSSKSSILWHSDFFMVQLSHLYMTTGKTIALARWTFVSKGMSLLFNTLSRLVIAFLPRSKHLLISRLQSPSTVILEPPKK